MRSRYRCSMCPAIHINSRSWLRSSSTHEPSDPPLRVIICVSRQFFDSAPSRSASFEQRIANGHRPRHGRRRHGDGARQRAFGYMRVVKVKRFVDDDGRAIATAIR